MPRKNYSTSQKAEAAFYKAIQQGSLRDMMSVWGNDDSVVCIHPGAPRLQGINLVREGWRQILENSVGLRFNITDVQATEDQRLSVHIVREEISVDGELTGVMLATNIYQLIDGSWRMMLHHASPEPDELYEDAETQYEEIVLH